MGPKDRLYRNAPRDEQAPGGDVRPVFLRFLPLLAVFASKSPPVGARQFMLDTVGRPATIRRPPAPSLFDAEAVGWDRFVMSLRATRSAP
jgi:hypothetical protein